MLAQRQGLQVARKHNFKLFEAVFVCPQQEAEVVFFFLKATF